jgi:hypothetical protein
MEIHMLILIFQLGWFNIIFSLNNYLNTIRPWTGTTAYNKRKWKVESDFKVASLQTESLKDRQSQAVSNQKDVIGAAAVGSVLDPRSHNRVNIKSALSEDTTYRQDLGRHPVQNPRDRVPYAKSITENFSQFSTTRDLGYVYYLYYCIPNFAILRHGTSKVTQYSTSYQGHVPSNPKNKGRMFDTRRDTAKEHTRDHLRSTVYVFVTNNIVITNRYTGSIIFQVMLGSKHNLYIMTKDQSNQICPLPITVILVMTIRISMILKNHTLRESGCYQTFSLHH